MNQTASMGRSVPQSTTPTAAPDDDTEADYRRDRIRKSLADFRKSVDALGKIINAAPMDHAELREARDSCRLALDDAFACALKTPA